MRQENLPLEKYLEHQLLNYHEGVEKIYERKSESHSDTQSFYSKKRMIMKTIIINLKKQKIAQARHYGLENANNQPAQKNILRKH